MSDDELTRLEYASPADDRPRLPTSLWVAAGLVWVTSAILCVGCVLGLGTGDASIIGPVVLAFIFAAGAAAIEAGVVWAPSVPLASLVACLAGCVAALCSIPFLWAIAALSSGRSLHFYDWVIVHWTAPFAALGCVVFVTHVHWAILIRRHERIKPPL